jgi:plasmid maintenance system antidote protein VapI
MVVKTIVINKSFLREELAGKQRRIAEMLGVHPNTLYRKIRGEHKLTLDELNQIAVMLGKDTYDFLSVAEVETDSSEQELNPAYDLEDVTDSLKEAFIDIHKGNTKPLEDLLNEL